MFSIHGSQHVLRKMVVISSAREVYPATQPIHVIRGRRLEVALAYRLSKRSIDIIGASIGLIVLFLLLPLIALCILWEDGGPIFYRQERIGLHGRSFWTYKLRSMIVHADKYLACNQDLRQAWQRQGKLEHDPRITRIGKLLRQTSLDELPQMFNILRGDMSLVGPRALQAAEISTASELEELRQMVRPGLTGLWQVCGRSLINYEQRLLLDCTYVLECSLKTDVHILARTVGTVLRREGAY